MFRSTSQKIMVGRLFPIPLLSSSFNHRSISTTNIQYSLAGGERDSFIGKNALVTGGSRGIGYSIAQSLAQRGCNVTILSRDEKRSKEALLSLPLLHLDQTHSNLIADLSSPTLYSQIDSLVESVKQQQQQQQSLSTSSSFKGYDIIVHAAGIAQSSLFMRMKTDEITSIINTNLLSPIYLTRQLIKPMIQNKWGRIIFIGSVIGAMGNKGQSIYGATKQGLAGFSNSLSKEVGAFGITSNVISPGYIETDMTEEISNNPTYLSKLLDRIPMGRFGQVDDISKTVMFVIESGYLTGQNINVNGGLYSY